MLAALIVAIIAYGAVSSLFEPARPRPANNSKRPDLATFTVRFSPDGRDGRSTRVAISWQAGILDGDPIAVGSPWINSVAVVDGAVLFLEAIPNRLVEMECWIHVNGVEAAHSRRVSTRRGCELSSTVRLP